MVAPGYFALLGIPLSKGRPIDPTDGRSAPRVLVVSETLARTVWRGEDPVGTRVELPNGETAEVVGVAGDVRTTGLNGEAGRTAYVPAAQGAYNFMTVVLKTENDPRANEAAVRRLVREMDAALPVYHVRTVDELLAQSVAQQRFQMLLVTAFSLLVFVVAAVGTYGVASYGVSERSGEPGIRLALREGARSALLGILIGGIAAVALSRVLTRFVFQIGTLEPVTFAVAPLLLGAASLLATFLPDPLRVLRSD